MKKACLIGALCVGLALALNLFLCPLVMAQQGTVYSKFPALNDTAAWDKIEQRRQARLEKVQGVTEFNAGNYKQAVKHFENFLKVFPDDAQGREFMDLARKWSAKAK